MSPTFAILATTPSGELKTFWSSSDAISVHLDQVILAFKDAVSDRRLTLSDPIWRHFGPKFEMGRKHVSTTADGLPRRGVQENLDALVE